MGREAFHVEPQLERPRPTLLDHVLVLSPKHLGCMLTLITFSFVHFFHFFGNDMVINLSLSQCPVGPSFQYRPLLILFVIFIVAKNQLLNIYLCVMLC